MIKSSERLWKVSKIFNKETKKVETVVEVKLKGMTVKTFALTDEDIEMFKELGVIL